MFKLKHLISDLFNSAFVFWLHFPPLALKIEPSPQLLLSRRLVFGINFAVCMRMDFDFIGLKMHFRNFTRFMYDWNWMFEWNESAGGVFTASTFHKITLCSHEKTLYDCVISWK